MYTSLMDYVYHLQTALNKLRRILAESDQKDDLKYDNIRLTYFDRLNPNTQGTTS